MNDNKNNLFEVGNSYYFVLSVFFVCVTLAALVFHNSNILYWYFLGVVIEAIHVLPGLNIRSTHRKSIDETDRRVVDGRDRDYKYR